MTILKVYNETQVTNGEMLATLTKLGFVETPSTPSEYRMQHTTSELYLVMPRLPLNEYILKGYTAKFGYLLCEFSILKDNDDLVKMILKERTKKRHDLQTQTAEAA
jgi:hypothetical protein